MFLGYLWDKSDTPDEFLKGCSDEEQETFFRKYVYELKKGIDEKNIPVMISIGLVFEELGFIDICNLCPEKEEFLIEIKDVHSFNCMAAVAGGLCFFGINKRPLHFYAYHVDTKKLIDSIFVSGFSVYKEEKLLSFLGKISEFTNLRNVFLRVYTDDMKTQ